MNNFVKRGILGLPIANVADAPLYHVSPFSNILSEFRSAAQSSSIGQALSQTLEADKRFIEIKGQILNSWSGGTPLQLTHLVAWYLYRANEVGLDQAQADLTSFLDTGSVELIEAVWVYGVTAETRVPLTSDIELVPLREMPESQEKDDFHQAALSPYVHNMPAPRAALVKGVSVPKVGQQPLAAAERASARKKLEEVATLLNCLSGVCCMAGFSTAYSPASVPTGPFAGSGGGATVLDLFPRRTSTIVPGEIGIVSGLTDQFRKLSDTAKRRFAAALHRLAQAKGRLDSAEMSLDLGIALEMLLLNAEHGGSELPGQLNLHFRLRGAWLIGETAEKRRAAYKTLGKIYTLRSKIAHNGFSDELLTMNYKARDAMLSNHLSIGEEIVRQLLLKGTPQDWSSIILGEQA